MFRSLGLDGRTILESVLKGKRSQCEDWIDSAQVIISRILRWAGHVARMEEGRIVFKMLTGPPTEKSPLGRPRHTWEGNIRMDLKEISINARNFVDLAQDMDCWRALVNAALNLRPRFKRGYLRV